MDPVTAFSLASNVIQVVHFGLQVIETARELYRTGFTEDKQSLKKTTVEFQRATAKLQDETNATASSAVNEDDKAILDVSKRCSATALELQRQLDSLEITSSGFQRGAEALKKAIVSICRSRKIKELEEKLESHRRAFSTHLLLSLRARHNLLAIQSLEQFESLDDSVKKLISDVANNRYSSEVDYQRTRAQMTRLQDEISGAIDNQRASAIVDREKAKSHVTLEVSRLRNDLVAREKLDRFARSLYFESSTARREAVAVAYPGTFQWIWEESHSLNLRWHSFSKWLKSESGPYWIQGKAGSGKSTLMRYLCETATTSQILRSWSGSSCLFTPTYFCWNPGSNPLQKSITGLLRSILYQIFYQNLELINHLSLDVNDISWTESRLRKVLTQVVRTTKDSCCYCLFLDGLDELEGDLDSILELLKSLANHLNVKICLSSRPWRIFEVAFSGRPYLRLQDLNQKDIEKYVRERLHSASQSPMVAKPTDYELSSLANTIVRQADGVFLWVDIVVCSVVEGIRNEDRATELQARVAAMPKRIEELWGHLFDGIPQIYKQQVARYLLLMTNAPLPVSILSIMLSGCDEDSEKELLQIDNPRSISEWMHKTLPSFSKRLLIRCCGLLELGSSDSAGRKPKLFKEIDLTRHHDRAKFDQSDKPNEAAETKDADVRFIHRTAADFCRENRNKLLSHASDKYKNSTWSCYISLAKTQTRWLYLKAPDASVKPIAKRIDYALRFLRKAEIETDESQAEHVINLFKITELYNIDVVSLLLQNNSYCPLDTLQDLYGLPYWLKDPLGVACMYGLRRYIYEVLDEENSSYLLICLMFGICCCPQDSSARLKDLPLDDHKWDMEGNDCNSLADNLQLIKELLENGADPNRSFPRRQVMNTIGNPSNNQELIFPGDATAWKLMLRLLQRSYERPDSKQRTYRYFGHLDSVKIHPKHCITAIELFCAAGADMDILVSFEWSRNRRMHRVISEVDEDGEADFLFKTEYFIYLAQSPLSLVERCLQGSHALRKIRSMFTAMDAKRITEPVCVLRTIYLSTIVIGAYGAQQTRKYAMNSENASRLLAILGRYESHPGNGSTTRFQEDECRKEIGQLLRSCSSEAGEVERSLKKFLCPTSSFVPREGSLGGIWIIIEPGLRCELEIADDDE